MTNEVAKIAGSIKIGEKEIFPHIVAQKTELSSNREETKTGEKQKLIHV